MKIGYARVSTDEQNLDLQLQAWWAWRPRLSWPAKRVGLKVLTGQGATVDTTRPEGGINFGILATLADLRSVLT
jgi:DNA invertase Pin-like site-specific DNA recombinase